MEHKEPKDLYELLNRAKQKADDAQAKALEAAQTDNRNRQLFKESFKELVKKVITPTITAIAPKLQDVGFKIAPAQVPSAYIEMYTCLLVRGLESYTLSFSGDYKKQVVTIEISIKAPTPVNPHAMKKATQNCNIDDIKKETIEMFLFNFFKDIIPH